MKTKEKLQMWQDRLAAADTAYAPYVAAMNDREAIYEGAKDVVGVVKGDHVKETPHVRNLAAEMIESQVNTAIPQPKVRARRKRDEHLAKLIEDMLRSELDRMPMEMINDDMERMVPIQGGAAFLVEWDNTKRTHTTVGEVAITAIHPRQFVPQDGVTSGIEEMDYFILKLPQTKERLRRRYGVDLTDENEAEPEIRGKDANTVTEEMVTQYVGYFRNEKGGIGMFSWVGDTVLCDFEDYQARRVRRCGECGAPEPESDGRGDEEERFSVGEHLRMMFGRDRRQGEKKKGPRCPVCGARDWSDGDAEYEELWEPVRRSDGLEIAGGQTVEGIDEEGNAIYRQEPTRIPYYKPDIYPLLLQKNVSVHGQLLGGSDIDKIRDQQNTTNRLSAKLIEKIFSMGSVLTLPNDAKIEVNTKEGRIIRLRDPSQKSQIDTYNLEVNIGQDMEYMAQVYEEARQVIGITDSFQGRQDTTAKSGKAKEFAAAQAAGRMESKRVMKEAAYAALFEAIFKFKLAYADEPRPVPAKDEHGETVYEEFNRWDFLERDAAGEWYWNDQFIFSCDAVAPLANNREAMWQETRQNLQSGAYGDPAQITTQIHFWTQMKHLHYPGAAETLTYMQEEKRRQEEAQAAQQMQMQQAQAQQAAAMAGLPAMPMQGGMM